ncbi:50S ribosomal protein L10 [Entomospira culicis]|uniref:Large ribosomal subunit protein uL10 n=1 Tax=Entomospira culicis TaxID=2719989 RepID=A0A968KUX4_9SPIO|nr:50S ribosomal protein L10 [Entomospira culicis]NIZ19795.1 50S ribosomal protein L10 [Entomospira culicis]NIZ70009.1 50S ribosomal protein L10 [Entomospira culicis]WDI37114.1 50S ribosomal protein L10 [Entomospira culicis]WDI38743.1 50S ribosomal protein L10 [Entomospira culicis]
MERKIQPKKIEAAKKLVQEIGGAKDLFFTEYQGLTVKQLTTLRKELRTHDATYAVVKNSMVRAAFRELGKSDLDKYFVGTSAIMFTHGEESGPAAKALTTFAKENKALVVKGGYVGGEEYDANAVISYSQLPTRIDLIAMLARTLNEPVAQFARALQAVADQKEA